jgi:Fur family ferric uptake transcriptional regulator
MSAVENAGAVSEKFEKRAKAHGVRLTEARRIILKVLANSDDHPDVVTLHQRVSRVDSSIGIATVYRTVKVLERIGLIEKHDFKEGRFRYELSTTVHHDHLIDLESDQVIEFRNDAIEKLQEAVAHSLGYQLVDHRLELYGVPLKSRKT